MTRLLYVCLFFWSFAIFSQEKTSKLDEQKKPLSMVISTLQQHFKVKFSYIDSVISGVSVDLRLDSKTTLKNSIEELQDQTKLKFEIIKDNFVTIRPYTKKDTIKICGYIFDEKNQPLKNIRVFFKGIKVNLITDNNGYFENTTVPYNSAILISAVGFRQKVLNSTSFLSKSCQNIYLINTIEVLEEVLLQEYLTKGITQHKKITTIDFKNLEILPGLTEPDVLHSIQLTPGVNSPFETASGIFVRGSTPNQNLVLWNGIKTYHQGHLFGMLSAFNPYTIKKVDFVKSGVSATYGDRIASVIDIKTENDVTEKFSGGAGFNMINADAVIHTPIIKDKVSLQISGRRSFTDVLETFTYKQYAQRVFQNTTIAETTVLNEANNDFYFADYNANLIGKLTDIDKLEINSLYSKNDLDFRRSNDMMSLSDNLVTENEGYNIKWTHSGTRNFSYNTSAYYTSYILDYRFITEEINTVTEIESKKNSVQDFGSKLDIDYRLSNNQSLIGGYHFSKNDIRYAFVTQTPSYELILDQDNRSLHTHSIYTEYKYDVPKDLYISAGLRYNQYTELNESYIEPRLFIQKHISKYWKLNLTGEYRSQAVSQIRESVVSDLSLENQVWTLANKDQFPVITSYQFELGSSFKKKNWHLDLDAYYKQIDNITTLTAGFINPIDNTYHNGESRVYGIDLFLKKRINDYKSWISYSYINTKNRFDDINNNKAFTGNWNIEHTIKWSHFYKVKNFQFSLGWLWHTGKAFTNISGVDERGGLVLLDFDEINGDNLPIYHRLDFSTTYDFKIRNNPNITYRLGLSVLNVYDAKNILNKEFRTTNSLDNRFINADIISLGITPNISFRLFW